jgi:hypothetical protein
MKMNSTLLAAALILSSVSVAAAQSPTNNSSATSGSMSSSSSASAGGSGRMAACRDDSTKYCAGKTGADRRTCLTTNMATLSDACKSAMSNAAAANR